MAVYPSCWKENPDGFQFCGFCRAPLTVAPRQARSFWERSSLSVMPDTTQAAFYTSHPGGADYVVVPAIRKSLGRSLLGSAAFGSISLADMTSLTGDTISAFVAPALGVKNEPGLDQVPRHSSIRSERRIAPTAS